jgi:hypothetical protein
MPFEAVTREWTEDVLTLASERFERRLAEEIAGVRKELHEGLAAVRGEMATMRVEWLRWSFLFWLGQIAATATMLTYLLRALGK